MDNLLFANIPQVYKDDDLRAWIVEHGFEVRTVRLIRDTVSNSSPSFARVELNTSIDDRDLASLNLQLFGDRRLFVRRGPRFS